MTSLSKGVEVCYLYHFSRPYYHAQHYVGSTDNWKRRHKQHTSGASNGSPLIRAAIKAGISVEIVWLRLGGKQLEAEIKAQKNTRRFCPIYTNVPQGDSNQ